MRGAGGELCGRRRVRQWRGRACNLSICTVAGATGHKPRTATTVRTLGALALFTCESRPHPVATARNAAGNVCGSVTAENADAASCTMACGTGHTPRTATAACSLGALVSFTCSLNPRTVPTVSDVAAGVRGTGVVEIACSASCTVAAPQHPRAAALRLHARSDPWLLSPGPFADRARADGREASRAWKGDASPPRSCSSRSWSSRP